MNDSFHPGQLATVLIDTNEVTSAQFMGYGLLDGGKGRRQVPVMRLNYSNRNPEDVFDVDGFWEGR